MRELIAKIEALEKRIKKLEENQFPEVMNKTKSMIYLFGYKDYHSWNEWDDLILCIIVGNRKKYPKALLNRAVDLAVERRLKKAREVQERLNQRRAI